MHTNTAIKILSSNEVKKLLSSRKIIHNIEKNNYNDISKSNINMFDSFYNKIIYDSFCDLFKTHNLDDCNNILFYDGRYLLSIHKKIHNIKKRNMKTIIVNIFNY